MNDTPPGPANVIKLNERDLVDYRAIQRTFDGAYARTALGQLCYAIIILRLFQARFFYVGLVYALLGVGFVPVAVYRYRMAARNADRYVELSNLQENEQTNRPTNNLASTSNSASADNGTLPQADAGGPSDHAHLTQRRPSPSLPAAAPTRTVLRKTFTTAGSVVAGATTFVVSVEIALLILILRL